MIIHALKKQRRGTWRIEAASQSRGRGAATLKFNIGVLQT